MGVHPRLDLVLKAIDWPLNTVRWPSSVQFPASFLLCVRGGVFGAVAFNASHDVRHRSGRW
jgi:hypothetical protein